MQNLIQQINQNRKILEGHQDDNEDMEDKIST